MEDREAHITIEKILRKHPRGLTISEISSRLRINRNSVAKYLEILRASGQVESRTVGTARIFCLAHRIPASALLSLASDLVCTLDDMHRILYTNEGFRDFFGLSRESITGFPLSGIHYAGEPSFTELFTDALLGGEITHEVSVCVADNEYHLRMKGIPTVFDDGSTGTTILLEDVTREWEYLSNLEFLVKTSKELADIGDEVNVFQYIVDRIRDIVPHSIVSIGSLDEEGKILTCRGIAADPADLEKCIAFFGRDIVGLTFPFQGDPQVAKKLSTGTLEQSSSLFCMFFRQVSEPLVIQFERVISSGAGYAMGCVCRGGIFGGVAILLKKDQSSGTRRSSKRFLARQQLLFSAGIFETNYGYWKIKWSLCSTGELKQQGSDSRCTRNI